MSARLAFQDVTLARGGRELFGGLSFDLGPGDALFVTGANGAGKSSLLRLAAGLLDAAAGTVVREGAVALADERPALDPALPLAKALGFWAGLDGNVVALDAVGLAHLAEVPMRMLSTGQRRRATAARAIAQGAPIWLLDEPANGLDAAAAAQLEALIAAHRAGGGIAVIASHQPVGLPGAREIAL